MSRAHAYKVKAKKNTNKEAADKTVMFNKTTQYDVFQGRSPRKITQLKDLFGAGTTTGGPPGILRAGEAS